MNTSGEFPLMLLGTISNRIESVGGGFVVNEKTKGEIGCDFFANFADYTAVDENLYYKGVDKHKVDHARLVQHHQEEIENPSLDPTLPLYPFHSGDNLLALTRKHNVSTDVTSLLTRFEGLSR